MAIKPNTSGRGQNGRFQVGNSGGPGRPPRQTELQYLVAISEACDVEKFRQIVAAAVDAAVAGDDKARSWLSSYLVGNANAKATSLSRVEFAERQLARDEELDKLFTL